mmetsp:Transcript_24326/g.43967  ORF Transcript_24326/g.43967 Transcript_24326/m.43967 type:complete len:97 (-) Transcript_24326:42-332(-)
MDIFCDGVLRNLFNDECCVNEGEGTHTGDTVGESVDATNACALLCLVETPARMAMQSTAERAIMMLLGVIERCSVLLSETRFWDSGIASDFVYGIT